MGFRFRKSKNLGPFRVTVSKSGVSTSFGGKGARITKTASGKVRTTLSVPGTGISYVTESGGGKKQKAKEAKRTRAAEAKAERQAAFAEAARNPAPAEAGLYRLLGVLTVVVGFALCFLFAPLGLVILACGVYVTVKARHIADKENRKLREAPPRWLRSRSGVSHLPAQAFLTLSQRSGSKSPGRMSRSKCSGPDTRRTPPMKSSHRIPSGPAPGLRSTTLGIPAAA